MELFEIAIQQFNWQFHDIDYATRLCYIDHIGQGSNYNNDPKVKQFHRDGLIKRLKQLNLEAIK
jgi:hypothetical protein